MARFYPRSEAAIAAEAAAVEEARAEAVVAAWAARVVAPPAAAPPGAAPEEGEAGDLLPFPPDSPTYSPLRPGKAHLWPKSPGMRRKLSRRADTQKYPHPLLMSTIFVAFKRGGV